MNTFLTSTGALALVKAFIDFLKYLRAKDVNGWLTQLIVWVSGVAATLVIKASDIAADWQVGPTTLDHAKGATVILAGLGLGSAAMLANTVLKAVDGTQSAATPKLIK